MGKFNRHAQRVNDLATEYFKEYHRVRSEYDAAERTYKATRFIANSSGVTTPEAIARAAESEAQFVRAKANLDRVEQGMAENVFNEFRSIRQELENDAEAFFAVNPEKIDQSTMILLDSGILTASEYDRLIDNAVSAGNATMARLIGQAASKTKNRSYSNPIDATSRAEAAKLLAVSQKADSYNSASILADFDNAISIYRRAIKNPTIKAVCFDATRNFVENF